MEDRHVVLHDLKAYLPSNLQSKVGKGKMKTLPEAQRTQGIESITQKSRQQNEGIILLFAASSQCNRNHEAC